MPRHFIPLFIIFSAAICLFSGNSLAADAGKIPEAYVEHPEAGVLPAVRITPDRVFFNGKKGKEQMQIITIRSPKDTPFSLALLKSELPDQVGFYIEKTDAGTSYRIHVRHKGEQAGTSRGRIILSTDILHRPQITIPVYSRIHGDIAVMPDQVDFGRLKQSHYTGDNALNPPVKSVNIKSGDGTVPAVKSLSMADPDRFTARIIPLGRIGITRIEISARTGKFEKGRFNSRMDITLDDPDHPLLSIPLALEFF